MTGGMDEQQLEALSRGRTPEEAEAYRTGQRMGAEGLMQMAGITPIRQRQMAEEGRLMNAERLNKATTTLLKYRAGKASVNRRVVKAQEWWKLNNWQEIKKKRGTVSTTFKPSNSGWLWNCIVGKHADAIDSYPEPIIVGQRLLSQAEQCGIPLKAAALLNLGEGIVTHGTVPELLREYHMDAASIASDAARLLEGGER